MKLEQENPELISSMSKSRNIASKIYNKKRKLSYNCEIDKLKSLHELRNHLIHNETKTSDGTKFLQYCEFVDEEDRGDDANQHMLIFMSDQGKWIGERSESLYMDGTFQANSFIYINYITIVSLLLSFDASLK